MSVEYRMGAVPFGRRAIAGILWAVGIYFLGCVIVDIIAGAAVEQSRPIIALAAAVIGAIGSWKGFLPGSKPRHRKPDKTGP